MGFFNTIGNFIKNAKYLKGMTKKSVATFISIENPHSDYFMIKLQPEAGFTWKAGEHVMMRLPGQPSIKGQYRMFSIASITEEEVLLFGIRTGKEVSDFKKVLINLNPGDEVSIQGAFGWFRIRDEQSPIVLFAGGVGITPVRSVVKELAQNQNRPIDIVFSSQDYYLFGDEIQEIADKNSSMNLHKVSSPEETQSRLSELAEKYGDKAYYYMSASPRVIESVSKLLQSKGIAGKRLIDDTMRGY